jgi:hypothetical protein
MYTFICHVVNYKFGEFFCLIFCPLEEWQSKQSAGLFLQSSKWTPPPHPLACVSPSFFGTKIGEKGRQEGEWGGRGGNTCMRVRGRDNLVICHVVNYRFGGFFCLIFVH